MFALSFGGSALVATVAGIPEPEIHDEFSYLLAADTFAQGRLANPTPPSWPHFESFHILVTPTYVSKYPPGQGLFLALGQVLFGHPIYGVWISAAAMCAALTWMLAGWLPQKVALACSLVAVLQIAVLGNWTQSYWGGAVTALGGALFFGALRRLTTSRSLGQGVLIGLGILVMAASRPLECSLTVAPAAAFLLLGSDWSTRPWSRLLPLSACGAILAAGVAAHLHYNLRTTGDRLLPPYLLYERTYGAVSPLLYLDGTEPAKPLNADFVSLYEGVFRSSVIQLRRPEIFVLRAAFLLVGWLLLFLGPASILAMQGLRRFPLNRWNCLALTCCGILILHCLFTRAAHPHYLSSVTPLFYALLGVALVNRSGGDGPDLASVLRTVLLFSAAFFLVRVGQVVWSDQRPFPCVRSQAISALSEEATPDLVFVRYGPAHDPLEEWVYNGASIEKAPIVWARDLGEEQNRKLIEAMPGRRIWQLYVSDSAQVRLETAGRDPLSLRCGSEGGD